MKIITMTTDEFVEILREELGKIVAVSKPEGRSKEYLNVSQLSTYIFLSVPAIYQRVANDSIPHSRIGSRIVFEKSEIDFWVKTNPKS